MNTFNNLTWFETDFHKNKFEDATEFLDMLHKECNVTPIWPVTFISIINNPDSTKIIGSYDFDRKTNENAYLILKIRSKDRVHFRLIIAKREYHYWHIGGILKKFELKAVEAINLNDLVENMPTDIIQIVYREKMPYNFIKNKPAFSWYNYFFKKN